MQKLLAAMIAALALVALIAAPTSANHGSNCDDYNSQADAQLHFETGGGTATNNVDGLDGDNDGVACEEKTDYPDPARDENPAEDTGGTDATPAPEMPETATVAGQTSGMAYPALLAGVAGVLYAALFLRRRMTR